MTSNDRQQTIPGPLVPRLEVIAAEDRRMVYVNGHLVASYACDDVGTERVLATQLSEVLPIDNKWVADAFGMHPVSLSRLRSLAMGGAVALMPRRRGPRGPHKVNPAIVERCRASREQGLSTRAIASQLSSEMQVKLSHVTVAALLKVEVAAARQQELQLQGDSATPSSGSLPASTSPALAELAGEGHEALGEAPVEADSTAGTPGDNPSRESEAAPVEPHGGWERRRTTRYAGAFLLYAALSRLDLWSVFRELGAHSGPARRFGWAQTVATVVFCFALRFRSIEDFKNVRRGDLGVVLGSGEAPTVLTLRTKIWALTESLDPLTVSRELFRRYLALEPVWEGLYYVDGHFCPYHGQHPTPRGWDAKRRLAVKGHTDVYVHDARGRALFFFSQPLNDSLARALPAAVEEIRRAHGAEPFTIVFDRGGYSGDAFRFLNQHGIGFITYLKGRKARRRYGRRQFRRGWFRFEGRRRVYRVFEKRTRVSGAGSLRTVLFLGKEGQQIPVLTNLAPAAKPARVVHCLRLRWRQENDFKYLRDNYAIDQIIQYGADPEAQDRLVANPRRKALKEQIRKLEQHIQALEAQLGRALDGNDERRRPTARGIKIAHGRLRVELARQRQALTRLENRLTRTPAKVSAATQNKTRSLLREDRRLLVNALKIAALNAEKLLVRAFDQYYKRPRDVFSVFRAVLHLPGTVQPLGPDAIEVRLQRPDSDKVARALELLLADINRDHPRVMHQGPTLRFRLQD